MVVMGTGCKIADQKCLKVQGQQVGRQKESVPEREAGHKSMLWNNAIGKLPHPRAGAEQVGPIEASNLNELTGDPPVKVYENQWAGRKGAALNISKLPLPLRPL